MANSVTPRHIQTSEIYSPLLKTHIWTPYTTIPAFTRKLNFSNENGFYLIQFISQMNSVLLKNPYDYSGRKLKKQALSQVPKKVGQKQ